MLRCPCLLDSGEIFFSIVRIKGVKKITAFIIGTAAIGFGWWAIATYQTTAAVSGVTDRVDSPSYSEVEPEFDTPPAALPLTEVRIGRGVGYTITELATWERPAGPLRVGIQSGHFDNDQVPDELRGLTGNTGAQVGAITERAVVRVIAELVQAELESAGIVVDLLPTTIPPGYVADAFVSIHADGNRDTSVRGHKHAPPRRDYSGHSAALTAAIYESYGQATGLPTDTAITNRMTAYYAFNWARYEHAIHPRTPAVIVETGFLTNAQDRAIIVDAPERAAAGIAAGILNFLQSDAVSQTTPLPLITPQLPLTGELICAPLRAERIARGQTNDPCMPAVVTRYGHPVLLAIDEDSSELATWQARVGARVTLSGTYVPVQTLDNYFWFRYEVLGLLQDVIIME